MAVERSIDPMNGMTEGVTEDDVGPIEVEVGEESEIIEDDDFENAVAFDANLAELIDEGELDKISSDLLDAFEVDERSRSEWLQTYVDGLDYLGFKTDDRTHPFEGASGVFHPVLSEAVVRFQSNAIMEIFPASGPVLTKIVGPENHEVVSQANRVKAELNFQLTDNMTEYRGETEKLLFRLPLAGSVFKKVYFDSLRDRPAAIMVPAEDFVVNYGATDLESAERVTHVMRESANKIKKLMRKGFYRTVTLQAPTPYYSDGKEKEDEIDGREPTIERDDRHVLLEFHVNYNLPEPFADPDDVADPYIITIEKGSGEVLSIRRNWKEDDENRNPDSYFVHYEYMPGLGFYAFGLIHLLGSIAKASTSILRQLIDAGTLSNLPAGLKTKGLRAIGGDKPLQPGEWRDIDAPGGSLKDNLFPLPYKEPSAVLAQLLISIVEEGRRIGSIADVEVGNVQENAPVGTTLALMERSLKVMSAVHARLHAALRRELKLIAEVIFEYMDPMYDWDAEGEFSRRDDFDGRVDILPVSDPNAATQAQKIVQLQAVMQLAQQNPELYNLKELHREGLHAIGIKNDEKILPMDQDPPRMDPVQENMAVLTSQPIKAYQEQDHAAHIQTHVAAMMDPKLMEMIGQSPNAPKIQGQMEAHIAEHLAFQYRVEIEQIMGVELPPIGEELPPEVENKISRLVANAALQLREQHKQEFQQKQAEETAADPVFQLREREVAIKERESAHKIDSDNKELIIDIAKTVAKEMMDLRRIESEETRAGAKIGADLVTFGAKLESEERREGIHLGKEIAENIRSDQRTMQKMDQDARDKAAERENKIREAREKAAVKKPSGKGSS